VKQKPAEVAASDTAFTEGQLLGHDIWLSGTRRKRLCKEQLYGQQSCEIRQNLDQVLKFLKKIK
jgi:hypothetical protein